MSRFTDLFQKSISLPESTPEPEPTKVDEVKVVRTTKTEKKKIVTD